MNIAGKPAAILEMLKQLRDEGLRRAKGGHQRETHERAFAYASNRVVQGHVKSPAEARTAFAAFADGFCTGVHRANGTKCEEETG